MCDFLFVNFVITDKLCRVFLLRGALILTNPVPEFIISYNII